MDIAVLRSWLAEYGSAWESRSPASAARLFGSTALYFETPYAEPLRGREAISDYWATVTADQREVVFESEPVGIIDDLGVAKWNAKFKLASTGTAVELNGVFLLEFDADGLCSSLREWWHAR